MNNLTQDERRALAFIAALLFLAAAVRLAGAREPVPAPAAAGFDLESHIAATERAVAEAERLARPLAKGERIDINRADAGELQRLPGVGPSLAERLVEARERGGGFRDAADLRRVPGVGARTAARMAEHLEFGGRPGGAPPRARGQPRAPEPLDVNRADAAALTALPGIGPVLAERIVAYRDSAGPFRRPEDLLGVRGIGPATLARLRDRLRVGRPRRGAGATGGSGGAGERERKFRRRGRLGESRGLLLSVDRSSFGASPRYGHHNYIPTRGEWRRRRPQPIGWARSCSVKG